MPGIPQNRKEFKEPVLKARTILFETENLELALSALVGVMSRESAYRVLEYETFRYTPMIPEGHPLKAELRAADAAKERRLHHTKKHRSFIIERDGGRCKHCKKEVSGRNATLDHVDPNGPSEPDNLQLLCRSCNSRKNRLSDRAGKEKLNRKKDWEYRQWEIRKPVWELIEQAQTCKKLNLAQEEYYKLGERHWWLPIDFFSEKAKEMPDYDGSAYQWAEEAYERKREFIDHGSPTIPAFQPA